MNKKVKPSQRLSKRIQQLTSGKAEADDLIADLEAYLDTWSSRAATDVISVQRT